MEPTATACTSAATCANSNTSSASSTSAALPTFCGLWTPVVQNPHEVASRRSDALGRPLPGARHVAHQRVHLGGCRIDRDGHFSGCLHALTVTGSPTATVPARVIDA